MSKPVLGEPCPDFTQRFCLQILSRAAVSRCWPMICIGFGKAMMRGTNLYVGSYFKKKRNGGRTTSISISERGTFHGHGRKIPYRCSDPRSPDELHAASTGAGGSQGADPFGAYLPAVSGTPERSRP